MCQGFGHFSDFSHHFSDCCFSLSLAGDSPSELLYASNQVIVIFQIFCIILLTTLSLSVAGDSPSELPHASGHGSMRVADVAHVVRQHGCVPDLPLRGGAGPAAHLALHLLRQPQVCAPALSAAVD